MKCSICGYGNEFTKLEHLPIYLRGSEGVEICPECKLSLTEHLRGIVFACSRARIQIMKEKKGE